MPPRAGPGMSIRTQIVAGQTRLQDLGEGTAGAGPDGDPASRVTAGIEPDTVTANHQRPVVYGPAR